MDTIRPYVNLTNLDGIRELARCHDAMAEAMTCYRHLTSKQLTFEQLVKERMTPEGCKAFIFGALTAKEPISFAEFFALYQDGNYPDYLMAVLDGIANYWLEGKPEPVWDELDLLYPEIPKQQSEGEFYLVPFQLELLQAGFTVADIGRMTMRGMEAVLDAVRGVVVADMSWLEGSGVVKRG